MDNSIRILATADLHLGKSSSDITGSHASTKFTLNKITEYCVDQKVDVLLLSGDIVDWDNRFFEAYGPLQESFDRLGRHGIKIYLVAGNHDFNVLPQIISTGDIGRASCRERVWIWVGAVAVEERNEAAGRCRA